MALLDFRRKLAAGEGGQACTGPNVAHRLGAEGSGGSGADANEPRPLRRPGAAEPQGENLHRRATAPDNSLRERQHHESDTPDAAPHSPGVVSHITQTKFRPLTAERRQQAVDLYRAGVPVKEIVRQTGVTGLERNHRFTDNDRAQAALLRQQGLTITEIARQPGFSRMTIGRYLVAARQE
ncbi:helix-turn-helix domain-containing protein [Actinomyces wuliandei]|uniref:helix-turn-helix domain-containing protein n=1 Tax=Actinomyces wuliandei TaxID=2057743 RepID=UPI00214BC81C|nr:helix-turn-helix domain-containing protein [Actinomyces wuliandei]